MDTTKVFTAFDNEENEILIYRENKDSYIDMINKERINKDDVDLEALRYLRDTVKLLRYMPETIIKNLYKKDRDKTLRTDDLLLGIKGRIINLKETKTPNGIYFRGIPFHDYHYKWDIDEKTYGIFTFFDKIVLEKRYEFSLYKNWDDGKIYIGFNKGHNNINQLIQFNDGMEYIYLNNLTLKDAVNESIIEKKKVYEYAYKLSKEKVN